MRNKKAIGLHWDIAILAFLISVGILMYYISSMNIPKIGEFSLRAIQSLENSNNIPIAIDIIMKEIGKKTTDGFDTNPIFRLKSYCYDPLNIPPQDYSPVIVSPDSLPMPTTYRDSLTGKTFSPPAWLSKRRNVKCLVNAEELGNYYWEAFDKKYRTDFSPKRVKNINLDFNYWYSVEKDGTNFFMKAMTDNKLEVPIKYSEFTREKQIGKFYLNPSFKIFVNYSFDEETVYSDSASGVEYRIPSKEVCILSRDCGANCQNVTEWAKIAYTPPKDYKIKKNPCNMYYQCVEPLDAYDNFGNKYTCKDSYPNGNTNYLCEGHCLPYCSALNPATVPDTDEITADDLNEMVVDVTKPDTSVERVVIDKNGNTECTEFSCNNYVSCADLSSATCGCPIPLIPQTNACEGSDCINLDCTKDTGYETDYGVSTSCQERGCGNYGYIDVPSCVTATSCLMYGGCPSGNSCLCSSTLNACEGDCHCIEGVWVDDGECGGIAGDGITDCDWNEKPQIKEYDPTTCHDPEYQCDARTLDECPCNAGSWTDTGGCGGIRGDGVTCSSDKKPQIKEYTQDCQPAEYRCNYESSCTCVPTTSCADLGCGKTDSCGTYCGACPPPPSCKTNCGECGYPQACDYDGDGDASDGQQYCSGGKEELSGNSCTCVYGGCDVSCSTCQLR